MNPTSTDLAGGPATEANATGHLDSAYIDWASIVGGALVAVAIFTTLMVFGSAIGLSLTSADPSQGVSGKFAAVAIGVWGAFVAASSFAAGGFIAGRLRHRIAVATPHEVEMRDGLHGLICWALAAIISAVLLASAIGTPAATVAKEAATTTRQVQMTRLFRGEKLPIDEGVRADAAALLKTISGHQTLGTDDRTMLAQIVGARTGAPAAEAEARVDKASTAIHEAVDDARRASVLAGFLIAVSVLVGAAAAWLAAVVGGTHRDGGSVHSPMTSWGEGWHRFGKETTHG